MQLDVIEIEVRYTIESTNDENSIILKKGIKKEKAIPSLIDKSKLL